MKKRESKNRIPYGIYCYGLDSKGAQVTCPNRAVISENGETISCCKYLHIIDRAKETLLWDQCKECGVREVVPARVIRKYIRKNKLSTADYRKFREQEKR